MSNNVVRKWINEDGIECCERENGKTYKTFIKGDFKLKDSGEIDWLLLDEDYRKLVGKHLQKIDAKPNYSH